FGGRRLTRKWLGGQEPLKTDSDSNAVTFSTIDLVGSAGRMAGAPPGGASTQDQRRERRVPFAARAVLHSGPTESQSRFVNFSESGCFIKTSGTLPPGSQVQLSFAMSGLVFRCSAIVRH